MAQRKGKNKGENAPISKASESDQFNVKENLKKLSGGAPVYGNPYAGIDSTAYEYNSPKKTEVLGNQNQPSTQGTPSLYEAAFFHTGFNSLRDKMDADINLVKGDFEKKIESLNSEVRGIASSVVTKDSYNSRWNLVYGIGAVALTGISIFVAFVYNDIVKDVDNINKDIEKIENRNETIDKNLQGIHDNLKELQFENKHHLENENHKE